MESVICEKYHGINLIMEMLVLLQVLQKPNSRKCNYGKSVLT